MSRVAIRSVVPILSAVTAVFALYLYKPIYFGVCIKSNYGDYCTSPHSYIASGILPLALVLLVFSVMALYVSRVTYIVWLVFTAVFGSLVVALLILDGLSSAQIHLIDYKAASMASALLYAFLATAVIAATEYVVKEDERRKAENSKL
jgi:hypothetical protein